MLLESNGTRTNGKGAAVAASLIFQTWQLVSGPAAYFERVAVTVTQRLTELLHAPVFIINDQGLIVTSSDPAEIGRPFTAVTHKNKENYLRLPFCLYEQTGEVIVGQPADGEVISPRLKQVLIQLVINQAMLADRLPGQHGLKNKFIYDLLHGLITDETMILLQAKSLGLDLAPPRAVILIDAADYILGRPDAEWPDVGESQIQRRAQSIINRVVGFFHLPNDTICAYIGDGAVAVLKASDTHNLSTWVNSEDAPIQSSSSWANLTALKRAADALLARLPGDAGVSINIGIGRYHPGIYGLARSYQDACVALSLGRRFHGHNRVHCLDELGIAAFVGVSDERTKIDLAVHLLSPLDYEPELLETLDAFFANDCCASLTASQLSIHRNTLSYRLDKITSFTGLDPGRFDDAIQIRLALLLRSFRPDKLVS
jgi:carbohydrate diacid regulator